MSDHVHNLHDHALFRILKKSYILAFFELTF